MASARFAGRVLLCCLMLPLCGIVHHAGHPTAPARLTKEELAVRKQAAGNDPIQLLLLTTLAADADAKRLRLEIGQILREQTAGVTADSAYQSAKRFAEALRLTVRAPAEIAELFGTPKHQAREILHRRYLEQSVYDQPLPLAVVFEFPKGLDPRLVSVHAFRPENP